MNELSKFLKEKRSKKKMSQHEFAKAIDMSYESYRKVERGVRKASKLTLLLISKAFKISIENLEKMRNE